jgi:hypothetical protein
MYIKNALSSFFSTQQAAVLILFLFIFIFCVAKQHRTVQFTSTFPLWCPVTAETAKFSFMFRKTDTVFKVGSLVERKKANFI